MKKGSGYRLLGFLAVLAIGLLAVPLSAQILYGSIVGVVKDAQGAVLPGATVRIINKDNNLTREAVTNAQGAFSLVNVLAGPYDVKISMTGFREATRTNVPVMIGSVSRVEMALELGTLTETVTVASEKSLLQTDKADVHTELQAADVSAMPLNRFRNYQALMNLVPGTSPMAFGNAETDTPARSLATNVNGQVNTNNSTRTDGATNMNIWLPNHSMLIASSDSVDTVNVSTSSFDAEQGMAGGAAVTVVTKSGTNKFKGSLFEYFNSDALNANARYFGSAPTVPAKLPLKGHIYGATVGGPVVKDKLFFFGSFEGQKRDQSLFTFFSVPDAALRAGDFSRANNTNGSLQTIYDPSTGGPNGTGRDAFPGNRIPTNRLDPTALRVMNLFPLPNTAGIGAGGLTNNYQRQEDRTVDRKNYDLKLNWNRTSSHQIWAKFSYMDAVVDDLTNYLGPDPNAEGDGGYTKVHSITAGHTWTLTPTLVMDMTFGYAKQKQDVYGPDYNAGNFGLDTLRIPGTNDQGTGDQRYAGYPEFQTGFAFLGNRDGWNPIFRDERTYSLSANITKLRGNHDFRTGYFGQFMYLDHWQPETGNPRGRFIFNANTTGLRGGQATNFYNQYASFMLGLVGQANKSFQNELMTAREWQHALFIRDRWSVNSKLTLDLGLRWEFYPIMTRADGRGIDRIDLPKLDVLIAGRGGNSQTSGMEASYNNFAPRFGAIYRINEKTVFRGGYGLTYNATPWARALRGDNDYPVTVASTFVNADQFAAYAPLSQGIPRLVGPDQSTGRVPLDRAAAVYTPEVGNVDRGYTQTWNISFERRLPLDTNITVGYVGAKGTGGYAGLDVNAPLTLGGGDASRPYAPQGRLIAINSWGQRLKTQYHSMQVAFSKPLTSKGLMFKGAYTLSKSMNESDADGRATLLWNTPSELGRNYSPAGFDRRHNLQVGFAYQLPWQSSGTYSGGFLRQIVNDWQLNGLLAVFSGSPFTVTAAGTSLNTPSNQQVANLVGNYTITDKIGNAGPWFDTSAFTQPTNVGFGNTGRNQFYGPGAYCLDLSIFRSFPVGKDKRIEARVEANNVLNHGVYANPTNSITSGTFGQITQLQGGVGIGGNANYPERQVRLGLRFQF